MVRRRVGDHRARRGHVPAPCGLVGPCGQVRPGDRAV